MPKICVFVSVNVQVIILHEKHQNRRKSLKRARDLEKRHRILSRTLALEEKPETTYIPQEGQRMTKKTLNQSLEK